MGIAATSTSWLTARRARKYGSLALGGLLTAAIGGFFAALFTYYATVQLNTSNALQQQQLASVQEFNSTGAKVDASVTDFADAVTDKASKTDLDAARKEVRQSIAAHTVATQGLAQVVGTANVDEYLSGLGKLRSFVDKAVTPAATLDASQARFDIMYNRTLLTDEARRRIYN